MQYHFFTNESSYSSSFIELLDEICNPLEYFVVFGFGKKHPHKVKYPSHIKQRILYMRKPAHMLKLIFNLHKSSKIFLHFLAYDPSLIFWATNKTLLKRSTWIVWGNDLYSYHKRNNSLRTKIYEYFRRIVIKNIAQIATSVKEDYDLVKEFYTTNAKYRFAIYSLPVDFKALDDIKTIINDNTTRFLVGNSGDPSNLHLEALDSLSTFKNEDIEITCILSYGASTEYQNAVIEYGNNIFGQKFKPICEYMDGKSYGRFLSTINVAIMNHKRQQGLGNIFPLLYIGCKVFMRSDITSYSFFKRLGCEIYDTYQLPKYNINELCNNKKTNPNKAIISHLLSKENCIAVWSDLIQNEK